MKKKCLTALKTADLCPAPQTRQKCGLSLAPNLQNLIQISAKKWARSKWGSRGAREAPIRTPSAGAVPAPPQHGPVSVSTWFLGV